MKNFSEIIKRNFTVNFEVEGTGDKRPVPMTFGDETFVVNLSTWRPCKISESDDREISFIGLLLNCLGFKLEKAGSELTYNEMWVWISWKKLEQNPRQVTVRCRKSQQAYSRHHSKRYIQIERRFSKCLI